MSELADYCVQVGAVLSPHGICGEVKVRCLSGVPERMHTLGDVCVHPSSGAAFLTRVTRVRQVPHKPVYILKLDGVDDRNRAEELAGAEITVRASDTPALPDDTYFVSDILGMAIVTDDGRELGRIVDVLKTGANDVYMTDQDILIPATAEVVMDVDIASNRMLIKPLPGLLD